MLQFSCYNFLFPTDDNYNYVQFIYRISTMCKHSCTFYLTVGQEESKVDIEDGIRFTPFNLREEYEEGEFDADGMYIFKKNKVCSRSLSC